MYQTNIRRVKKWTKIIAIHKTTIIRMLTIVQTKMQTTMQAKTQAKTQVQTTQTTTQTTTITTTTITRNQKGTSLARFLFG